jgi:hypothetical protein
VQLSLRGLTASSKCDFTCSACSKALAHTKRRGMPHTTFGIYQMPPAQTHDQSCVKCIACMSQAVL